MSAEYANLWDDIKHNKSFEELFELLQAYDEYIIDYMDTHGECADGCTPACFNKFLDNDFPGFVKTWHLVEKDGCGCISVDARNEDEVMDWAKENLANPRAWRVEAP